MGSCPRAQNTRAPARRSCRPSSSASSAAIKPWPGSPASPRRGRRKLAGGRSEATPPEPRAKRAAPPRGRMNCRITTTPPHSETAAKGLPPPPGVSTPGAGRRRSPFPALGQAAGSPFYGKTALLPPSQDSVDSFTKAWQPEPKALECDGLPSLWTSSRSQTERINPGTPPTLPYLLFAAYFPVAHHFAARIRRATSSALARELKALMRK
jgi:hypothetical protein